jgi:hypothetical protein
MVERRQSEVRTEKKVETTIGTKPPIAVMPFIKFFTRAVTDCVNGNLYRRIIDEPSTVDLCFFGNTWHISNLIESYYEYILYSYSYPE